MKSEAAVWIGAAATAALAAGSAGLLYSLLLGGDGTATGKLRRYTDKLERDLKFLRLDLTGKQVACAQTTAVVVLIAVALIARHWLAALLVAAVAVGPAVWLRIRREKRVARIEEQMDGWLMVLANSLTASASLGEALGFSATHLQAPIGQEIDLLVKEFKLGVPLDQAMENMNRRLGSHAMASALLTLRVARNAGGDLPAVLETSAASLRELARLEGVARTRTAEGKTQTVVIGLVPFVLFGGLHCLDPDFLRPLTETFAGHLIVGASAVLWFAAMLIARKIMVVDI